MPVPSHLAIIMDGNGRWAEMRRLPRIAGHRKGVEAVRSVVGECQTLGIDNLTLFAFSSENWGRPAAEVNALMGLLGRYLKSEIDFLLERRIRLRVIGEMARLPSGIRKILEQTLERTAGCSGMVLTLALSYGARDELVRAVRRLGEEVAAGALEPSAIDEEALAGALDTAGLPDPDLLIRTSGEMRISNFLLWQLAYTELYFCETLWPDFSAAELHRAIEEFGRRERRFGLTRSQVDAPAASQREGRH